MDFKKRLLINIGISLSVCLVLLVVLFSIASDINKKTEHIKNLKTELFFRLNSAGSLAILTKEAEEAKNYNLQLEKILPRYDQLVNFPRDINIIAKQAQIDINTSLGKEETPNKDTLLKQTNFSLAGQGSFENFINFLKFLEIGQYLIKIQTLDFTKQDGNFKILLTGRVFSLN